MFERGKIISQSELTDLFNETIKKINELTASEIQTVSSGQILSVGTDRTGEESIMSEILDVQTEQYFDSHIAPTIYKDGVEQKKYQNYLQKFFDDVKMIRNL